MKSGASLPKAASRFFAPQWENNLLLKIERFIF